MASKATLFWCCLLVVHHLSAATDETLAQKCDLQGDALSAALQGAADCGENPPWSAQLTTSLLLSMRNVVENLHKHQLKACQGAEPKQCPDADVPNNGGLVCVTVAGKRLCKSYCNDGYDFSFLRRSRLYDECGEQWGYRWGTTHHGGNRLAVCTEAVIQISGVKSAYFPKGQDCLTTKNDSVLHAAVIDGFIAELRAEGVTGDITGACLVCGGP